MITITDKRIVKYLQDKDALVKEGRLLSDEIARLETKILNCETKEKKITGETNSPELTAEAEKLQNEINEKIKEFEVIANQIQDFKMKAIPKDLEKKHLDLMKLKEEKERERNKIALKIQKIKDRVVPKIQAIVKPQLKEFEDVQTAEVKGDVVEVSVYSRLDEWKEAYKQRNTQ